MEEMGKIDELRSIYEEMDDEGKERVISLVEEYLSVQSEKGDEKSIKGEIYE